MSVTRDAFTEFVPDPLGLPGGAAIDAFVDRLRSVRDKVGRWMPHADQVGHSGARHGEVFRAAVRLDSAVQALDARVADACESHDVVNDLADAAPTPTVLSLVRAIEVRVDELETILTENNPLAA